MILTEAQPIAQTTQNDRGKFIDGRIFVFNVKSINASGDVVANTGALTGKFLGQGAGVWDSFKDAYPLDGSMGGGWSIESISASSFEFDGTGNIPAGGAIEITIRDWNQ